MVSMADKAAENIETKVWLDFEGLVNKDKFPGPSISFIGTDRKPYFNFVTNSIEIPVVYKNNPIKLHDILLLEYGHYIQLQAYTKIFSIFGYLMWIESIGVPSIVTTNFLFHNKMWYERNANNLSRDKTGEKFYKPGMY